MKSSLSDRAGILVVDDDRGKLASLRAILAPLEEDVVLAHSGRDALRKLLRSEFALILLDVRMADMDGFETAELIRQRRRSERTPIIFITSFDSGEMDPRRGYLLGAVDFIFSPIVPEILLSKVRVFVELHRHRQELSRLYAAAQEASNSKSQFLNMAAHELRTPLSVVMGYLSMLSDGSLGEAPTAWEQPLAILNAKTQELHQIVEDLLTASRIEAGALPRNEALIDLRSGVREAVKRAQPKASLVGGTVESRTPSSPVLVTVDPKQLALILSNLVDNALTYCDEAPRISITVEGGAQASVRVADNGVGIRHDMHQRVFERFFRLRDADLRAAPGTGLGLYLSREIAEAHGGRLLIERSEPGQGSVFTLVLPTAELDSEASSDSQESSDASIALRDSTDSVAKAD